MGEAGGTERGLRGRGGPTRDVAASPLPAYPEAPCGHSRLSVRLPAWRVPGVQTAGKSRLSQHWSLTLPQRPSASRSPASLSGPVSCASRATGPSSERSSGPRGCRETILCSGSERGLWSLTAWVLLLALPLTGCVTLGQSLTFPCFRFPAK